MSQNRQEERGAIRKGLHRMVVCVCACLKLENVEMLAS